MTLFVNQSGKFEKIKWFFSLFLFLIDKSNAGVNMYLRMYECVFKSHCNVYQNTREIDNKLFLLRYVEMVTTNSPIR